MRVACIMTLYVHDGREHRLKFYNESDLMAMETELQYTQQKTFYFNPNTSDPGVHEDDIICTVNIAMAVSCLWVVLHKMTGYQFI